MNMMKNAEGYYDLTAYEALMNVQKGKAMQGNEQVYRGEIWFVEFRGGNKGSEQDSGRPAIIVSNDKGNEYSNMVEVVYLTSVDKKPLPTHVDIMCRVPSTALCEQIHSVSKERLLNYTRTLTAEEMQEIDKALMISLGLTEVAGMIETTSDCPAECFEEKEALRNQIKKLESEADKMMDEINDLTDENKMLKRKAPETNTQDIIRLETERDLYKKQAENYLERLLER